MEKPRLFYQREGFPSDVKLLNEWAEKENVELVDTSHVESSSEYLDLANKHNPYAIINSAMLVRIPDWTDEFVANLPSSIKLVASFGAGYDALGDIRRYKDRGILVSNTPNSVTQSTADLGLYLIIGALRNFGELAMALREGNFHNGVPLADEYDNKTLGILGLGRIGALLRDKVEGALGFSKIQYHNRHEASPDLAKDTAYVSFDELLATSDVIVLSLPLNKGTYHIINRDTIAKTKKGVIIINIGRGPLIDEEALVEGLESGHIGSVGLDVYEHEPKIHPKLIAARNTMLLPHAGSFTTVTRTKMLREVIDNLDSVLKTGKAATPVPELGL